MIELKYDAQLVTVDTEGAWIMSYSNAEVPILYPKGEVIGADGTAKTRGGCHVCLPNFGPGGSSSQPQHGYGRLVTWSVASQSQTEVILSLEPSAETEQCAVRLRYSLDDTGLAMELSVTNAGRETVRLAPGFHPYFAIDANQVAYLNQAPIRLPEYTDAQFVEASHMELKNGDKHLRLAATGMTSWALWTDQLAAYFCIEPTVAGFAFESDATPGQLLEPGGAQVFQLAITAH